MSTCMNVFCYLSCTRAPTYNVTLKGCMVIVDSYDLSSETRTRAHILHALAQSRACVQMICQVGPRQPITALK